MKSTFWDVIERTLEKAGVPLSAKEIWDKANELGTIRDFKTEGKTPWATIAAYCYTDINNNGKESKVIQTSERPALFFLRKFENKVNIEEVQKNKEIEIIKKEESEEKHFKEKDLYPILSTFVNGDAHFKANIKTILHEYSTKASKGKNEWLHPDLVGVYFPFINYKPEILEIQNSLSISSIKLFSFEMKINLGFTNLRQAYFQAVSNSSWANEGYLVVLRIDEDPNFMDEIRRLNNAFGIGVIRLNSENVFESEILFPSQIKSAIDWDTVNRLAVENSHFRDFLKMVIEDCKLGKIKSQYDKVMKPEELEVYIKSKKISMH